MMRILLLSILFSFFFCFHLGAQKSSYSNDTTTINQQIKKALVLSQNPATIDSANYYLDKFYTLSVSEKYDKGIIEYFRIKAVTFFIQQKEDSLTAAIEQAINKAK